MRLVVVDWWFVFYIMYLLYAPGSERSAVSLARVAYKGFSVGAILVWVKAIVGVEFVLL